MRMYFKQRLFSWFDSYDIYNEQGNPIYVVKGQISWGHCLKIFDPYGNEAGTVKEQIFTFLPKFEIYQGNQYLGCIKKEFSFLKPRYDIDYNGWISMELLPAAANPFSGIVQEEFYDQYTEESITYLKKLFS